MKGPAHISGEKLRRAFFSSVQIPSNLPQPSPHAKKLQRYAFSDHPIAWIPPIILFALPLVLSGDPLPDSTGVFSNHWLPRLATKRLPEFRHVRDHAINARSRAGECEIGLGQHAQKFVGGVLAPISAPTPERAAASGVKPSNELVRVPPQFVLQGIHGQA